MFVFSFFTHANHINAAAQPASSFPKDGKPPKGATILFNGKDLSQWINDKGEPCKWTTDKNNMLITNGGDPLDLTHFILTLMYEATFSRLDFGSGSAISYLLTVFVFVISVVQLRMLRRKTEV